MTVFNWIQYDHNDCVPSIPWCITTVLLNARTHLSVMCRTAWFRSGTVCRSWIGLFWWAAGPHRPARVPSPSEPRDPRWSPGNGRDGGRARAGGGMETPPRSVNRSTDTTHARHKRTDRQSHPALMQHTGERKHPNPAAV